MTSKTTCVLDYKTRTIIIAKILLARILVSQAVTLSFTKPTNNNNPYASNILSLVKACHNHDYHLSSSLGKSLVDFLVFVHSKKKRKLILILFEPNVEKRM